jgi:serpin B
MDLCPKLRNRKRFKLILTVVLIMVFLLPGCVGRSGYAFLPSDATHIQLDDPVVLDINNLGFNALRLINKADTDGSNLIISPISLSTALSILNNGAAGTTLEQINGLINSQGLSQDEYNSKYKDLVSSFYNRKDIEVLLANSLWVNREYQLKEDYIQMAKTWYDADVFSLDVKSPSSVKKVNEWISDRTKGMITNPISDIDPLTITLLVNSLYFKGAWVNEFNERLTQKEDYTLSTGETVKVDMMNEQFKVPYYETADLKAVKLHYKDGMSMFFLRPEGDVNNLVDELTADMLLDINSKFTPFRTNLKVPKLNFGYKDEMSGYLKSLGMVDAFDNEADFSHMIDSEDVKVNRVLHECRIELDEEGTVAAAVTVIEAQNTSAMPEPEEIVDFYLDKPFVFVIFDNQTGTALFMGKVENPLEQ